MNWPTPRKSVRIARTEYIRSLRAITKNPVQMVGMGIFVLLFMGVPTVGGSYVVYRFGDQISEVDFLLAGARGGVAVAWIGIALMIAARAVGKTATIDHESGMLTTVPPRDVAGGLLLAELGRIASVGLVPVVAMSAAWALALGSPLPFVAAVATVLGLLSTALITGHIGGILFKTAFAESKLLARYKTIVFAVIFVAYFGAIMSNTLGDAMFWLGQVLQDAPTAWFGDALLLGVPAIEPSITRVVGAVALVAVGVPVLLALDVRAATRLWYADAVRPDTKEKQKNQSRRDATGDSSSGGFVTGGLLSGDGLLSRVASRPTLTVTANVWRRTKRAPIRLLYAVYPVFMLATFVQTAVASGTVTRELPVVIALYGTWIIGASALNPLGDEGAMLPVTLTSNIRGGQFVHGHVLAVTLVGLPVVVAATAVTGALSPLTADVWVPLTVASAILSVAGAVVAIGIGTVFPRFGEVRVTRSRHVVVPSKTAFLVYSVVVVGGFVGAAVAAVPEGAALASSMIAVGSGVLWRQVEISALTLRVVGGVVAVLLGVVAPPLAYRFTVRTFDEYRPNDSERSESWGDRLSSLFGYA